ncbi:hypothetical protein GJ496_009722 [Pomphorhynchus laevis]|nr:hypothetical protein GJ496_009722 [Pomphorhynchus laevis]
MSLTRGSSNEVHKRAKVVLANPQTLYLSQSEQRITTEKDTTRLVHGSHLRTRLEEDTSSKTKQNTDKIEKDVILNNETGKMVDTTNIYAKEANLRTEGSNGNEVETSPREIIEEILDLQAGTDEQRIHVGRGTRIQRRPRIPHEDFSPSQIGKGNEML